jgi:hypothetical protein
MRAWMEVLLLSAVIAEAGCSSIQIRRLKAPDLTTEGVRFYRSLPYLLVTASVVVKSDPPELLRYDVQKDVLVPVLTVPAGRHDPGPAAHTGRSDWSLSNGGQVPVAFTKPGPLAGGSGPPPDKTPPDAKGTITGAPVPGGPTNPTSQDGSKTSGPGAGPIAIVYLPDPCEEYAITQRNVLSSQTVGITLNDGWELASLQATSDNTGVANALIGAAGSILGGGKSPSPGGAPPGGGGAKQGALPPLFVRTVTYTLTPGIYPLFERVPTNDKVCEGTLRFVNPWDVKNRVVNEQITPLALPQ